MTENDFRCKNSVPRILGVILLTKLCPSPLTELKDPLDRTTSGPIFWSGLADAPISGVSFSAQTFFGVPNPSEQGDCVKTWWPDGENHAIIHDSEWKGRRFSVSQRFNQSLMGES